MLLFVRPAAWISATTLAVHRDVRRGRGGFLEVTVEEYGSEVVSS